MRDPRRLTLVLTNLGMFCPAIAVNLVPVFLTTFAATFGGADGLNKEQLGRIGAALFAGVVIGIAVAGPLADRYGAKRFAVGGHLLAVGGMILFALAPTYELLLAAGVVMGLGAGAVDMVLSPIIAALEPHRRGQAINLLHGFYWVGAVLTIFVASTALSWGISWRVITLAMAVVPLAVGLATWPLPLPAMVSAGQARMPLRRLVRLPVFVIASAAMVLVGASELSIATWLPAFAEHGLGRSAWAGGMALTGFSLMMAAGRIGVGLAGRFEPARLMTWCCASVAGLYLISALAPWATVSLVAAILIGLAVSPLWPTMMALTADRFPQGGATLFALLGLCGNVGCLVAPWVIGAAAEAWNGAQTETAAGGLRYALAFAAIFPVLLGALLISARRAPRDAGPPTPHAVTGLPGRA